MRTAGDPDAVLLDSLQSTYEAAAQNTYEAAANLAGWDRAALER